MSDLSNIIKKEVRELLTPGSVASVVIMVILFACLGGLIGDEVQKSATLPKIGLSDNYEEQKIVTTDGEWDVYSSLIYIYSTQLGITEEQAKEYVVKMNASDIENELSNSDASFALVITDNFAEAISAGETGQIEQFYVYKPAGMIGSAVSSTVSTELLNYLDNDLSKFLYPQTEIKHANHVITPIDGSKTHTYIKGVEYDNVTPFDIANTLSGQTMFVPIIIMIIIMMVGSIVISSMGSEKENKTLETLLTLPIKRTTIVTGKIIAAAIVGLVFGAAYMVGMGFYIGSITSMSTTGISGITINLADYGLGLGITEYALIMVSMFLAITCALAICMILGAFAKNYKSAQTMTMPLSILAIIPMFITMFTGWYGSNIALKTVLFIIPFSHPMMAMEALMNDDMLLVLMGIAYMAVFAVVGILITVRLYKSDILITGLSQNKYVEMLKGGKTKKL